MLATLLKFFDFSDKKLWDWLKLLIVPLIIIWATNFLQETSRKQEILTKYIQDMTSLMVEHELIKFKENKEKQQNEESKFNVQVDVHSSAWITAKARTINAVRSLDKDKEKLQQIIRFLKNAKLLPVAENSQTSLFYEADLSGLNLSEINLNEVGLVYANLKGTNLQGAFLCGTDLTSVDIDDKTNLKGAFYNDKTTINSNYLDRGMERRQECWSEK